MLWRRWMHTPTLSQTSLMAFSMRPPDSSNRLLLRQIATATLLVLFAMATDRSPRLLDTPRPIVRCVMPDGEGSDSPRSTGVAVFRGF